MYYRTRDGRADYRFSFERQADQSWRIYVTAMPPSATPRGDPGTVHLIRDDLGCYYVCWTDAIRTRAHALHVASTWADAMQRYIRTGRRF